MISADTQAIVDALDRLADVVRGICVVAVPAPEPPTVLTGRLACPHQAERRISFASSGNDDFYCPDCQVMVAQPHAADPVIVDSGAFIRDSRAGDPGHKE